MVKKRKRFLVEFPDDVTDLIVAHPGGHVDLIEVDHGDSDDDDDLDEPDDGQQEEDSSEVEDEPAGRARRRR